MAYQKLMHEIFQEFEAAPDRDAKIQVLRRNDTWALRTLLQGAFDKRVGFDIEKVPYYKPNDVPVGMAYSTIHTELGRIYLFEKGNPRKPAGLTKQRQEQILIQSLEVLDAPEAVLFMNMMLKDLKVPGLDETLVLDAFPGLYPRETSDGQNQEVIEKEPEGRV